MLASRALLAKQAAAMLVRQPACLMHHGGDWGNWGNTNIAVVFSGCGWVRKFNLQMRYFSLCIVIIVKNTLKNIICSSMIQNINLSIAEYSYIFYNVWICLDYVKDNVQSLGRYHKRNVFRDNDWMTPCKLNNDVERIMKEFHRSRKPIGLSSMAPLLACRVLPNLEVTMGYERDESSRWGRWPNTTMVQAVKSMGAYVDEKNKVISTPTFMWETDYHYHYIFDGIGNMVKHVMRMTAK
uniref:Es1 protein n=1 Tax=Sinocyclocheilus grahami TaxID=75366 RepID=A0A672LG06_SINGR